MADNFDPYREPLVVETRTVWTDALAHLPPERRRRIAERLHAEPEHAGGLEYDRLPAGFCRRITVTPEDVARVEGGRRGCIRPRMR